MAEEYGKIRPEEIYRFLNRVRMDQRRAQELKMVRERLETVSSLESLFHHFELLFHLRVANKVTNDVLAK